MNSTFLLGAAEGVQWGDFLFILILFVVLMLLIRKVAWNPVSDMMEKRANKIAADLNSAEEARKKAEELADKRQIALKDSHVEASKIIERAKQNGEQQKASIVDSATLEVKAMKDNAKKEIQQERKEALASVKNDVAELSIEIAAKIIQKELNTADQKALVDSYIEGLGKQNGIR